jgi:2-desacetyl-2-hydroxyethyl bacteriochlorophyllide A dehydrogenase
MRQVVVDSDRIDVSTVATPAPQPGEVLVRSVVTGVCGSDTHAAHGRHPFIRLPYRPGHEVVGIVEHVPEDVSGLSAGDRVVVEPFLPCWGCKMCRTGRQNLCENLQFFGCGYVQGGMAEYFTIAADRLHRVPDELSLAAAALIEPLSTPVHAVRLAGEVKGKAVAVLGAGTIGLLVLAVLRAHGAGRIVMSDLLASKRDRAMSLGADAVVDAASSTLVEDVRAALGESADVVFDCVAVQATIGAAVAMADKGGTVVVVGVPAGDVTIPLPAIQDHQIRIQGSATYLPEDYAESIDLLSRGAVDPAAMITSVYSMSEVAEAFGASAEGEQVKVLVTITGSASELLANQPA